MSELNKVPGLFPNKTSLPASNTVSVRSNSLNAYKRIFGFVLYSTAALSCSLLASPCSPSYFWKPWNSQAKPGTFVTDSYAFPFTGGWPPYSTWRGAWGQVQSGAQEQTRWWRLWTSKTSRGTWSELCFGIKFQFLSQKNQFTQYWH